LFYIPLFFYDEHTSTVDRALCISIQSLKREKTKYVQDHDNISLLRKKVTEQLWL